VQVLLTRTTGAAAAETVVVLERVTIYSIGYDERATFGNPTGSGTASSSAAPLASLTLVVTAEEARTLANARHSGELDVALLPPLASVTTPAQPPAATTPATSPTVSGPSR
jgi:hypothetical protein